MGAIVAANHESGVNAHSPVRLAAGDYFRFARGRVALCCRPTRIDKGEEVRIIGWAAAAVLVAMFGWKFRGPIAEWVRTAAPVKPFVFDNGTVRQREAASDAPMQANARPLRNGELRKCVRGTETTYTNVECPRGYAEKTVDKSGLNVLPAAD